MWHWVYDKYSEIPIYPIFYLLKRDCTFGQEFSIVTAASTVVPSHFRYVPKECMALVFESTKKCSRYKVLRVMQDCQNQLQLQDPKGPRTLKLCYLGPWSLWET